MRSVVALIAALLPIASDANPYWEREDLEPIGEPVRYEGFCGGGPISFDLRVMRTPVPGGSYVIAEVGDELVGIMLPPSEAVTLEVIELSGDETPEVIVQYPVRTGDATEGVARDIAIVRMRRCDEVVSFEPWVHGRSRAGCFQLEFRDDGTLRMLKMLQPVRDGGMSSFETDAVMDIDGQWRRIGADLLDRSEWINPWTCAGLEDPDG